MGVSKFMAASLIAVAFSACASQASAQSLVDSLALAYSNSADLNVARSTGRATDEGVGIAKSLLRPKLSATATAGWQELHFEGSKGTPSSGTVFTHPATFGVTLTQPLFTGFQATAKIKGAEFAVLSQQELIRDTEQTVLLDAATAYMDVVMYSSIVMLDQQNLEFLAEQVRASKDRLQVGEGTKTDLAQSEARYQAAVSTLTSAKATLAAAKATFVQYVGIEPKKLSGAVPFEKLVPSSLTAATESAMRDHPALKAAIYNIDVAQANVSYAEGALLPQVNLQASATHAWEPNSYSATQTEQVGINVTVPLYQGGGEYATIRQAKEQLGTARIQVDVSREKLRNIVATEWAQVMSSNTSIAAAKAQIDASELALQGTIEQRKVGERTTLDVLNAENDLSSAKITLAQVIRQRSVALFTLLQAVGRFDADHLRLASVRYDPKQHYEAVKDQWIGVRTPDGR